MIVASDNMQFLINPSMISKIVQ